MLPWGSHFQPSPLGEGTMIVYSEKGAHSEVLGAQSENLHSGGVLI